MGSRADARETPQNPAADVRAEESGDIGGAHSVLKLQARAGNHAVVALLRARQAVTVSREPAAPDASSPVGPEATPSADEVQWEADWSDETFKDARRRFKGNSRPKGTPKQRYKHLCPFYKAHGIPRPLKYVSENIVSARFFHRTTPAHRNVRDALTLAEADLKKKGHTEAPFTKAWAFNPRTTSGGSWSNHADGRAIDIDPETNPHLTNSRDRKVINLLTGYDIEAKNPGAETGEDSYDSAASASDAFRREYSPDGLRQHIEIQKVANIERQAELDRLKTERPATRRRSDERKSINRQIKEIERAMKAPDILAKELKRYESIDKGVVDAESAVADSEAALVNLQAAIQTTADKKEIRSLRSMIRREKRGLKKARKALTTAEGRKSGHKLRQYANEGFLDLNKDLVESMTAAGFTWGGDWKTHKDFMHFDI